MVPSLASCVFLCIFISFLTIGPGPTRANVISPFKLLQWSILKDKQAQKAQLTDHNLVSKEKQSFSKKSKLEDGSMENDLEQSTLTKEDLRWKEKRVLATDLTDAEEKLFVGHIPDIEDVGVFHPIPVPSNFEAYDVNPRNDAITLFELKEVTKAEENIADSFLAADKNGDGLISRSEFLDAPWWLEVDNRITSSSTKESVTSSSSKESAVNDVEAAEDQLPFDEHRSWHYILNGMLPQQLQQQQPNPQSQPQPKPQQQPQPQQHTNDVAGQVSIDLEDAFAAADTVLLSDDQMVKLRKELNLR